MHWSRIPEVDAAILQALGTKRLLGAKFPDGQWSIVIYSDSCWFMRVEWWLLVVNGCWSWSIVVNNGWKYQFFCFLRGVDVPQSSTGSSQAEPSMSCFRKSPKDEGCSWMACNHHPMLPVAEIAVVTSWFLPSLVNPGWLPAPTVTGRVKPC